MRDFKSPMVNEENFKFVARHPEYRTDPNPNKEALVLINRVIKGKKPFAYIVMESKREATKVHNQLKRRTDVVVSKMWFDPSDSQWVPDYYRFYIARLGTLSENFDLKALAARYKKADLPEVVKDIKKKANYTLASYFGTFDYQEYEYKTKKPPWTKLRKIPVEPWETGLVLGYPIASTIHLIYYCEGET